MIKKILKWFITENCVSKSSSRSDAINQGHFASPQSLLESLKNRIKGLGHPEYPFLDAVYSPNSRVPCTDFSSFIVDCLKDGDTSTICLLLREIVAANPGLGIGPDWVDEMVLDVCGKPFEEYVCFENPNGVHELRALFILAGKDGGGREFLVTSSAPEIFSTALACQAPHWQPSMDELVIRANKFIRRMRRDTPYWKEFPLFKKESWAAPALLEHPLSIPLRSFSVSARLQLFYINSFGPCSLSKASDYSMRNLGLNHIETAREFRDTDFLVEITDAHAILTLWSKKELANICENFGIDYRKGWNKEQLLHAIESKVPTVIEERMKQGGIFNVNAKYKSDFDSMKNYSRTVVPAMNLLCFS